MRCLPKFLSCFGKPFGFLTRQVTVRRVFRTSLIALVVLAASSSAHAGFILSAHNSQNSTGWAVNRGSSHRTMPVVRNLADGAVSGVVFFSSSTPSENAPLPSLRDHIPPPSEQGFGASGSGVSGASSQPSLQGTRYELPRPRFAAMVLLESRINLPSPLASELFHPPRS